jgi:trigger factor
MKLEVTELGPVKRALKIEIPEDEVNRQFAQAYAELNRQVRLPGFRPGKAPLSLLEQRYAKMVEEDLVRRLVPDYYNRAIRQAGVVPVLVEVPPLERVKIKKNMPFSFTATVEIKPRIELRDYRPPNPISLKPDKRVVTDDQIAKMLEALREQHAQLDAAPAGKPVTEGDFCVVDAEGFLEGNPLGGAKQEGQVLRIGAKSQVLGVEVEEALIGQHQGDVIEIPQSYPAEHPDARVAGKTVVFRLTVKAVKQKRLPELDDEFAKDCGPYSSLDELKAKLHEDIGRGLKKDIEDGYKDQILARLAETHHFEAPESLVERELSALVRQHLDAERRRKGQVRLDDMQVDPSADVARLRTEHREEAKRRVKLGLILEAIAGREGLSVTQEDMDHEVQRLASQLRLGVEDVQRLIQAGGQDSIEDLKGRILAEKALEFVFRHAVIQG